MKTLNIKDMSIEKLKSMAYDTAVIIEQNQRNLQLLNQEIAKKAVEKVDEPKIKAKTKAKHT